MRAPWLHDGSQASGSPSMYRDGVFSACILVYF